MSGSIRKEKTGDMCESCGKEPGTKVFLNLLLCVKCNKKLKKKGKGKV